MSLIIYDSYSVYKKYIKETLDCALWQPRFDNKNIILKQKKREEASIHLINIVI